MSGALPMGTRIVEGIMTTLGPDGEVNVAPMGPLVDAKMTNFVLRPFQTSTTYRNLKATGQGVFHITDNALMIALAAIGRLDTKKLALSEAEKVRGLVLDDACRYHELVVASLDDTQARTTIVCRCVHAGRLRDFFGFHRGRHAVLEAAILATRLHLTGSEPVLEAMTPLQTIVDKTGGEEEHAAMAALWDYVKTNKTQPRDD